MAQAEDKAKSTSSKTTSQPETPDTKADAPNLTNTGDGSILDPAHTQGANDAQVDTAAGDDPDAPKKRSSKELDSAAREAVLASPPAEAPTVVVKVEDAGTRKAKEKLLDSFLDESGYRARDVDVVNLPRRTVGTTNGGKYQLTRQGNIRTIKGPRYPKELVEA